MASIDINAMSPHHLEGIPSGYGDRFSLSIRWNNGRFVVHLDPSATGNTVEDFLIGKYNAACIAEDYDEEAAISDQILDSIVDVGRPIFNQLAPRPDIYLCVIRSSFPSLPRRAHLLFRTVDNTTKLILTPKETSSEHG